MSSDMMPAKRIPYVYLNDRQSDMPWLLRLRYPTLYQAPVLSGAELG